MARHTITLPGDGTDFGHWRSAARSLWMQDIAPADVVWHTEDTQHKQPDLFGTTPAATYSAPMPIATDNGLTVPRSWMQLAEQALLHHAPERFAVLYQLLWRMQYERGLRHDLLDTDQVQMRHWVQAVRREIHKMHAFVRFRPVGLDDAPHDGHGPLHVAWFEPTHHVVQAAAPFFVQRFTNMRWSILTPQCSLRWWPQALNIAVLADQGVDPSNAVQPFTRRPGVLSWGPGASISDAPAPDAGEALWLTYYAHTFNPARLKVAAMRKEMPRRYWRNLPESPLISPLIQAAHARSAAMLGYLSPSAMLTTQRNA